MPVLSLASCYRSTIWIEQVRDSSVPESYQNAALFVGQSAANMRFLPRIIRSLTYIQMLHKNTHRHTNTQTHRHRHTQTHNHTHRHTHIHTHTHAHAHTHTHAHTHRIPIKDTYRNDPPWKSLHFCNNSKSASSGGAQIHSTSHLRTRDFKLLQIVTGFLLIGRRDRKSPPRGNGQ